MSNERSAYRQVFGSISLFGGTQVLGVLVGILRTKAIALLTGATGIGLYGIFNNAVSLIGTAATLGLDASGVKALAQADGPDAESKRSRILQVLKKLFFWGGLAGGAFSVVFCVPLSLLTFENTTFWPHFVWIGAAVLFKQLSMTGMVALQGMRKLRRFASLSLLANFLGLLISVPLYYFYGIQSIVPAIVISAGITYVLSQWLSSPYMKTIPVLPLSEFRERRKDMLRQGLAFSFSAIVSAAAIYLLQVFVSREAGLDDTGIYNAFATVLNTYAGMVFSAMATDYFPRLSSVVSDKKLTQKTILQQSIIGLLIITPLILILMALTSPVVSILYSDDFLQAVPMIRFGLMGMLFRVVSLSVGYLIVVKTESRLFMRSSAGFSVLFVLFGILGYRWFGLEGLGIAYAVHYFLHFIGVSVIVIRRYGFSFDLEFNKVLGICMLFCLLGYFCIWYFEGNAAVLSTLLVFVGALCYAVQQLEKRMSLRSILMRKFNKNDRFQT